ncbi:hypothetical protein DSN97_08165 [Deferribacteraceae bacterium V6Fe1]|nr:hypothetical protein DSN97_08165 [Deferribacteraceae bacterium V6Fe1]
MVDVNIKFVKLVSGDSVMGKLEDGKLKDVVQIQAIPAGGGVQLAILPFGFPFEEEVGGEIKEEHILYEYQKVPEELVNKYLETKSNIKIASSIPDVGPLGGGKSSGGSGIIL